MKRWCGILIVVLLLFVLAGRNWFAPRQAKPMADIPKKTEYQQQIASLPKQEAPSAVVHKNASQNEQTKQNSLPEAFRVTLLSSVPGRTRFRFELDDFTIQEETINGKTYSRVQLDGAWPLASKGRPALPVIRRDFVVAKGRQASMWITDVQEERIACAPPKPSVGELPRTAEALSRHSTIGIPLE